MMKQAGGRAGWGGFPWFDQVGDVTLRYAQ